jgi:Flp pilus assembly protein TadD
MNRYSCFKRVGGAKNWARLFVVLFAVGPVTVACQTGNSEKPTVVLRQPKPAPINPAVLDYVDRSIKEGRLDEARSILESAMVADPKHGRTRLLIAELRLASGDKTAAARLFSQLTGAPELAARAYQGLGIASLLGGQREKAAEALTKSVKIDPTNWRAWNGLGFYHDSVKQWDQAHRSYTRALLANPNSAIVYSNRGYSRVLSGDVDAALPDLFRAVDLDPRLEIARINLRIALAWKGRYREALLGVDERKMGATFNNVGYVALMRGDRATAETYFREAMKIDATFNETAWRNLGYLNALKAEKTSPRLKR